MSRAHSHAKGYTTFDDLLAAIAGLASVTSAADDFTNPVVITGYKMFEAVTGAPFAAKGVDYYPRPNAGELDENNLDFFTDDHEHLWSKDIEQFKKLGINAIRLYSVDPSKSHDAFMCALRANGIYALVDLAAA